MYLAASLFSGRETMFNSSVADRLERKGYPVILPQRDGFEFTSLRAALSHRLDREDIEPATKTIIYLLDVGKFIPESKVILANWDEPIDEGVTVEVLYGRMMGKSIVGFRTDVRSPYGEFSENYGGMHGFLAFQNDALARKQMPNKSSAETEEALDELVERIDKAIIGMKLPEKNGVPEYILRVPHIEETLGAARILFNGMGLTEIKQKLDQISERYVRDKSVFEAIRPRMA